MPITIDDLRRHAVARSLFSPTTLNRALHRMGFVQADPIRAPARAQDLILRHRVKDYRAGDLERRYTKLGVDEDFFINYGFVTRTLQSHMHPRSDSSAPPEGRLPWPAARRKRAELLLDFVRQRGVVHPQEVDDHFSHGEPGFTASRAARGRDPSVHRAPAPTRPSRRCHAERSDRRARRCRGPRLRPLPAPSLRLLVRRLRFATPQWQLQLTGALRRAQDRLTHAEVDGLDWFWPAGEDPARSAPPDTVRLLAPFDPVVWDRARFERLWGWVYRFEAYTPALKRKRGYYALPLLWRDRVIGWSNLSG